jgi:hypothetical protein
MVALPMTLKRFTVFPNPPGAGRRDMATSSNVRPSKRQS